MSSVKRVLGNYTINTVDASGAATNDLIINSNKLTLNGDLDVIGASTTITSTDLYIVDNVITLNSGELGAGVTKTTPFGIAAAGIVVDRGTIIPKVGIRYNDTIDAWEISNDGTTWNFISASPSGTFLEVKDDVTPQLGGNLDVNSFSITSAAAGNIVIVPDTTGELRLEGPNGASIEEQVADPGSVAGYNKLYSKTQGIGKTGLYFANTVNTDELISKSKAVVYSLIL